MRYEAQSCPAKHFARGSEFELIYVSGNMTSIVSNPLSDQVLPLINTAWDEIKDHVKPPTDRTITKFAPSTTCKVLIDWVHAEVCYVYNLL